MIAKGYVLNHNMSARIIRSNQSLVLQKVTRLSAGKYVCSAVNSEGETRSNDLPFRVQFAPTCRYEHVMIVGASRGESLDIACEVDADPPVRTYKWKFNNSGETLDVSSERYLKTSNGSISMLKYTPVSDLDYGTLSCWATNSVGHQEQPCMFQIVAAGKPFPVRNCTLSNQTSSSVEVFCIPGFDGGLPQHFILELYTSTSAVPRYNLTAPEPHFILIDLEPDVTFRIVVFAVNAKGRSVGVSTEEVLFTDAEKRTASDSEIPLSPVLGIIAGIVFTLIIIVLVILIRMRRLQDNVDGDDQKSIQEQSTGIVKNLHRNVSPRDFDERDPDIIPAKYGSPETDKLRFGLNPNIPSGETRAQWINPGPAPLIDPLYSQYSSPQGILGTYPRDLRPKDLHIVDGEVATVARSSDLELNGLAIKERLMANRLPESCV